jgi:transcriptional regulator of arginine metabolism
MTKTQRQHKIAQLLGAASVTSQAQLVSLLRAEGIVATQATVSRDLVELGAIKLRGADGRRSLTLPVSALAAPAAPDHLRRVLSEWVVDVTDAGPMVVVKTPPGCAHVVASALDRGVLSSVLGTVAGDDTIFVVVNDAVGGAAVASEIRAIAGLPAPLTPASSTRKASTVSKRGR